MMIHNLLLPDERKCTWTGNFLILIGLNIGGKKNALRRKKGKYSTTLALFMNDIFIMILPKG